MRAYASQSAKVSSCMRVVCVRVRLFSSSGPPTKAQVAARLAAAARESAGGSSTAHHVSIVFTPGFLDDL